MTDQTNDPELLSLLDRLAGADAAEALDLLEALRRHPNLAALRGPAAAEAARQFLEQGPFSDLETAAELAWRAQEDEVAGAGRIFATAIDRYSVLRSRKQRFGTFAYDHQGDLIPAPLDGSISDEQRQSLGLGTLADLQAELDEANRAVARRRAIEGGLAPGQTYVRVWRDPSEAELRTRWAEVGEPVWSDGDELTFVCDRPIPGAIVGPLFELPMWRVGELLVLTVRVHRLDEAVLTYGFWPLKEDGTPAFTQRPDPDGRWRGPNARPPAPTNDIPVGTITDVEVASTNLGRARRVSVYRPSGHTPAETLPVVYATDGQWMAAYARRVDAAIEAGEVPRCVIVASHASGQRTGEYFPGYDPTAFTRHERFFVEELAAWAESTLGVSTERDERVVFGCSDGGAYALTMGLGHAGRFGKVIAYSSGLPPTGTERWPEGRIPYMQLCAGVLEGQFYTSTHAWHAFLELSGIEHHWTERVCGHEMIQWVEELPAALGRALNGSGENR